MSKQLCRPPKVHLYLGLYQRNEILQLFISALQEIGTVPGGRSRVKTTVNTSDLLLLIEQTEIDIFYDHFLELLCWQVARRSRVTTTVNTSSANGRASYYCADYSPVEFREKS